MRLLWQSAEYTSHSEKQHHEHMTPVLLLQKSWSLLLAAILLGSLLILWCSLRRGASARLVLSPTRFLDFPMDSLPSHTPGTSWSTGVKLHRLRPRRVLSEAFYHYEEVDTTEVYVLRPFADRPTEVEGGCGLAFLAHASRCGSTLLTRLVDARADAISYREPRVVADFAKAAMAALPRNRARALSLLRAVLRLFVEHARNQGARLALVKLPSVCSHRDVLECLYEAAPTALRVHVTRPVEEILRSHLATSTLPTARAADFELHLIHKQRAASSWASAEVPYDSFAGPHRPDLDVLSSAFGLPSPTMAQLTAMISECRLDAKRGGVHYRRASEKS